MTTPPEKTPLPRAAIIGVAALALLGVVLLTFASFNNSADDAGPPTFTQVARVPTRVVLIPTTTPVPTRKPTAEATATSPAITPTKTETAEPVLTVNLPANVRSGPGINYPVIGGMQVGETAVPVGRDSAAQWFVIALSRGRGWLSRFVANYDGDINSLPVVAAPPSPVPTITPSNAPQPATQTSARGITGELTLCDPKTTYAVAVERICFVEVIRNTTGSTVRYGVLGVQATNLSGGPSQFQTSWSGDLAIDPNCTGPTDRCGGQWEDGMKIGASGAYRLTLQICYSSKDACLGGGEWETLTAGITITVQ
jgi:uncharacterized protein YraI